MNTFPSLQLTSYRIDARSSFLKATKEKHGVVYSLGIGSPNYEYPTHKELYKQALPAEYIVGYPSKKQLLDLKETIVEYTCKDLRNISSENICLFQGSKQAVTVLTKYLFLHRQENKNPVAVLLPHLMYSAYLLNAEDYDVPYYTYTLGDAWLESIEEQCKQHPEIKMVWCNFPNNPSGQVVDESELIKLIALAQKYDFIIAYDSAYKHICFDGYLAPEIMSLSGAMDCVVELCSISKSYSAAGLRMGWIVGNAEIADILERIISHTHSGIPGASTFYVKKLLEQVGREDMFTMQKHYQQQRDALVDILPSLSLKINKKPLGGLYLRATIPKAYRGKVDEFVKHILETHQIFLLPGNVFDPGDDRHVRLSFSEYNEKIELRAEN